MVNTHKNSPVFKLCYWVERIKSSNCLKYFGYGTFASNSSFTLNGSKDIILTSIAAAGSESKGVQLNEPKGTKQNEQRHTKQPTKDETETDSDASALKWRYLAASLNRVFFCFHVLVTVVVLLLFYLFIEPY